MTWSDPTRKVALLRRIAAGMLAAGQPVHCVWTGRRLSEGVLFIEPLPTLVGMAVRPRLKPHTRPSDGEPARKA